MPDRIFASGFLHCLSNFLLAASQKGVSAVCVNIAPISADLLQTAAATFQTDHKCYQTSQPVRFFDLMS